MLSNGHQILIVTDAWKPQINGVVTTLNNLVTKIGVEVFHPGLVKSCRFPFYRDIAVCYTFSGLKESIKRAKYIHIATEGPLGLYAKLYCDHKKYKYTTGYHTNFDMLLKTNYSIPYSITNSFITYFHKKSACILVPTKSIGKKLNDMGLDQTVVWTRGVSSDFVAREEGSRIPYKKKLLYVGRISKEKNLTAFFNSNLTIPHSKTVVGNGPMLEKYKKDYPNVNFVGAKSGQELINEYLTADVFVFPSKFDTFGLVQIEAMYCGTPVAAYPVPGPIDVIEQGVTGYTDINLETAIEKALNLDRKIVANQARKNWNWNNCCDIFVKNLVEKER